MARRLSRNDKKKWVPAAPITKKALVRIPPRNNDNLIAANKLTIIGRVSKPLLQRPRAVIDFLPQIWNLEGRVAGRDLGPDKFQFCFESEADLLSVLNKGPYHFKRWMLILQKWEPVVSETSPSSISFWIRVHGLPLHFWNDETLDTIGDEIGFVAAKAADDARIRIELNGMQSLPMTLEIQLPSDEVLLVEFEYLKIEKHCFVCFSLFHEEVDCPIRPRNLPPPKERNLGITQRIALQRIEAEKKRHDDRRGYSCSLTSRQYSRDLGDITRNHRHHSSSRAEIPDPQHFSHRASPRTSYNKSYHQEQSNSGSDRHPRELSSGKIVGGNEILPLPPLAREPLGDNTPCQCLGSQVSHTPPARLVRDRLEFPSEHSSAKSRSSTGGRKSALDRIQGPSSRSNPALEAPTEAGNDSALRDSSSNTRVPAVLRLQEPDSQVDTVNISIPVNLSKPSAKRRLTKSQAAKRVARSPLKNAKLKSVASTSAKPPRFPQCVPKECLNEVSSY
ncbi:DUF4283 domain-containing protein [Raphanus sativus]|nr:DUF4283 domain-containing protein [Raphanus sativus]